MTTKHLHVISFNVPEPPDYGGVIDVYYRVKALHEAGISIHLHCFKYGRQESEVLKQMCAKIYYYKRNKSVGKIFSGIPFIVYTRNDSELLSNLVKDDYPILFEGIHCCFFLKDKKLKDRLKIIRSHNIEHEYYLALSKKENNPLRKLFFKLESSKLRNFERVYKHADTIAAISASDELYFKQKYGKTFLMLPSHPFSEVQTKTGIGTYILYHGNLSVKENEEAALYILSHIAPFVDFNFIIAGKDPGYALEKRIKLSSNIRLINNPTNKEMQELILNAHINLLPTFQPTGFKLKLLNALFTGRFCIGTPEMTANTGLTDLCSTASNPSEFRNEITKLLTVSFSNEMIDQRKLILKKYSNKKVISKLLELL